MGTTSGESLPMNTPTGDSYTTLASRRRVSATPIYEKKTTIEKGATSNRIFAISSASSATATGESIPKKVTITNEGTCPAFIISGYETYSDESTVDAMATQYLHSMLMPFEEIELPVRSVISTEDASTMFDGTQSNSGALSKPATTNNLCFKDAEVNLGVKIEDSDTTITTEANGTNAFRVGDLIQIGSTAGTTVTDYEIMEVLSIDSTTVMTVKRSVFNSFTTVDGDTQTNAANGAVVGSAINFAYFNGYHESRTFPVVQTDRDGKYKSTNFFGHGRAMTGSQGIVPGSVLIQFYEAGYQALGLSGINANTESGLTAGTSYEFDITVDGGTTFDNLSFTVDSTNTKFGGANGIISKIQSALDAQFYVSGNLFEKKVHVGIVDGDIRFTSGQHLSTSAISVGAGSSGTADFLGSGRIPAGGKDPIAAKTPDKVVYDRITYSSKPNTSTFCYDDGLGNLLGTASGTINYETGAINFTGAPPMAEFKYLVNFNSVFSGKVSESAAGRKNTLIEILANTPSEKNANLRVRAY